jgi:hypothetical protein
MSRLEDFPLASDTLLLELAENFVGDVFKVVGAQCENGWTGSRKTDTEETWMCLWCDRREDFWQTRDLFGLGSRYNFATGALTSVFLYGWCTLSCIAWKINSGSGGDLVKAVVKTANLCKLKI